MTLRPDAVPPLVTAAQAQEALDAYDLPGPPELRFLKRGFNDHYEVSFAGGSTGSPVRYILRIYLADKPYIRSIQEFESELTALVTLKAHGVPVSAPVARRDGTLLGMLDAHGHARPVALFAYAPGEELKGGDIGEATARNLGQAVARMHVVADAQHLGAQRYTLDETFLIDRPVAVLKDLMGEDAGRLTRYGERLKNELRLLPRTPGAFGFIHGDLHTGNFRVLDSRCTLFDFDHSAQGWRAYDLAVLRMSLLGGAWTALLDGYRSVRPFTAAEEAAVPLLEQVRQVWDPGDFLAMRATGAWGRAPLSEQGQAQLRQQVQSLLNAPHS